MFKIFASTWGTLARTRVSLYEKGWLRRHGLERPVISIGALSVGGAGKTPTTAMVAALLCEGGLRPAILSRGYRRRGKGPLLVSAGDGRGPLVEARRAGDEPFWMASVLPEVAVAVARRREEGARLALASGPRDVFLLDDGFQHVRVRRDADLLVVNPEAPFWEDTPVPSGRLRERPTAARRAHAFLLIGDDDAARAALAARFDDRPVFTLQRQPPLRWPAAEAPPAVSAATPPGRQDAAPAVPVFAFAGIARPQRFFAELERHEVDVRGRRVFADHHPFRESDLAAVATAARRAGAEMLMTTEKDAVRLPAVLPDIPVHVWGYRLAAREPRRLVDWLRRQANLATRPDAA